MKISASEEWRHTHKGRQWRGRLKWRLRGQRVAKPSGDYAAAFPMPCPRPGIAKPISDIQKRLISSRKDTIGRQKLPTAHLRCNVNEI